LDISCIDELDILRVHNDSMYFKCVNIFDNNVDITNALTGIIDGSHLRTSGLNDFIESMYARSIYDEKIPAYSYFWKKTTKPQLLIPGTVMFTLIISILRKFVTLLYPTKNHNLVMLLLMMSLLGE
jgi:hypothetical protein